MTVKDLTTQERVKSLYLITDKINGHIEATNGNKNLTLTLLMKAMAHQNIMKSNGTKLETLLDQ